MRAGERSSPTAAPTSGKPPGSRHSPASRSPSPCWRSTYLATACATTWIPKAGPGERCAQPRRRRQQDVRCNLEGLMTFATNGPIVIDGATIIDGNGGDPRPNGVVVVEGNRIAFVGDAGDMAAEAKERGRVVDGPGKYVLPGVQNHHEHLDNRRQKGSFQYRAAMDPARLATRSASNALLSLLEGVTTVRDLGAKGKSNIHIRDTIEEGILPGPRVFACGEPLAITGGHAWQICRIADGVPEVRQAVREQIKAGADFVKLMASGGFVTQGTDEPTSAQYSAEEVNAAIQEAH